MTYTVDENMKSSKPMPLMLNPIANTVKTGLNEANDITHSEKVNVHILYIYESGLTT